MTKDNAKIIRIHVDCQIYIVYYYICQLLELNNLLYN